MTEAQDGRPAGIGSRLRAGRERRGLSLLQAAEEMHVDPAMIEALEAEDFGKLGAPVFVRGHLRNYAQRLGEAPEPLLALYAGGAGISKTPDLTAAPRVLPMQSRGNPWLAPAGIALVVAVGAIGGWLWLRRLHAVPVVAAAAAPALVSTPASAPTPTSASPAPADAPLAAAAAVSSEPAAGEVTLVFSYSADSWTEVYDAHGRRLYQGLGTASSTQSVRGQAPLKVVVGNSAGVTLEADGHAVPVPDSAPDRPARFTVGSAQLEN